MKEGKLKHILQSNRAINRLVVLYKEKEKHVSYGKENPDKTFFVIRRNAPDAGLFSFAITNIGWIKYAIDNGYIPVVDMENYSNAYITKENVGKINAWDYYFKQPSGYYFNDIAHSKNVIISSLNAASNKPDFNDLGSIDYWNTFSREYFSLSDAVINESDRKEKELFDRKRVLGVLCRGTDYSSLKPHGHPIQPDPNMVIEKANEEMKRTCCEKIYLATEDESIYEIFVREFGDRLLTISTERYSNTGKRLLNEITEQNENGLSDPAREKYKKGFDYAVTIGLLSRCKCLVAGQTSGTLGALLLTKGYESVYLFDLGNYS